MATVVTMPFYYSINVFKCIFLELLPLQKNQLKCHQKIKLFF